MGTREGRGRGTYGHAKLQVIDPSAGPSGVAVLDENEEK